MKDWYASHPHLFIKRPYDHPGCNKYLPKGTDLSVYSQEELDAIADEINNRPRKGLGIRSPLSVYRELLLNSPQHSTLIH
jgi:hypothetical protein